MISHNQLKIHVLPMGRVKYSTHLRCAELVDSISPYHISIPPYATNIMTVTAYVVPKDHEDVTDVYEQEEILSTKQSPVMICTFMTVMGIPHIACMRIDDRGHLPKLVSEEQSSGLTEMTGFMDYLILRISRAFMIYNEKRINDSNIPPELYMSNTRIKASIHGSHTSLATKFVNNGWLLDEMTYILRGMDVHYNRYRYGSNLPVYRSPDKIRILSVRSEDDVDTINVVLDTNTHGEIQFGMHYINSMHHLTIECFGEHDLSTGNPRPIPVNSRYPVDNYTVFTLMDYANVILKKRHLTVASISLVIVPINCYVANEHGSWTLSEFIMSVDPNTPLSRDTYISSSEFDKYVIPKHTPTSVGRINPSISDMGTTLTPWVRPEDITWPPPDEDTDNLFKRSTTKAPTGIPAKDRVIDFNSYLK